MPRTVFCRTPLAPGRFLDTRFLRPARLSQTDAARLLGISRRRLNEIVVGRRAISADTALRLAALFGPSPAFWLQLQCAWDLACAARALRRANLPSGKPSPAQEH
ncbi:HigA family addiction module antitoxin [Crenobacter caeni]|uniref:HigA family addiction module antitoxin n=1 Tax=Crenobacter caeni TaxID=2705474 RepID=UPI00194007C5|nr:HigA family addiction module antitoxin [Crenobacter caeni]